MFTTFVSLTRLTTMLAAATLLLAATNSANALDGMIEVPFALNPNKRKPLSRNSCVNSSTWSSRHGVPPAG